MPNAGETVDEAIARIAKQNHLVHFVPGEDGFGGEDEVDMNAEAALRQIAELVYRDAAEISRRSAVAENGDYIHKMSKIARLNVAQDLERKAQEVSRGQ